MSFGEDWFFTAGDVWDPLGDQNLNTDDMLEEFPWSADSFDPHATLDPRSLQLDSEDFAGAEAAFDLVPDWNTVLPHEGSHFEAAFDGWGTAHAMQDLATDAATDFGASFPAYGFHPETSEVGQEPSTVAARSPESRLHTNMREDSNAHDDSTGKEDDSALTRSEGDKRDADLAVRRSGRLKTKNQTTTILFNKNTAGSIVSSSPTAVARKCPNKKTSPKGKQRSKELQIAKEVPEISTTIPVQKDPQTQLFFSDSNATRIALDKPLWTPKNQTLPSPAPKREYIRELVKAFEDTSAAQSSAKDAWTVKMFSAIDWNAKAVEGVMWMVMDAAELFHSYGFSMTLFDPTQLERYYMDKDLSFRERMDELATLMRASKYACRMMMQGMNIRSYVAAPRKFNGLVPKNVNNNTRKGGQLQEGIAARKAAKEAVEKAQGATDQGPTSRPARPEDSPNTDIRKSESNRKRKAQTTQQDGLVYDNQPEVGEAAPARRSSRKKSRRN